MITVADVVQWLERFSPTRLAESWDNVGLLWGDADAPVSKLMTCLTVTARTAAEAIDDGAQLVVSHHPVLFRPVKRVRAGHHETGMLWDLARAGVSIASPHTAFDNTAGGINDGLAHRLGLEGVRPLRPTPAAPAFKIMVFTPRASRDAILTAAFAAGAGRIGAYDECSFSSPGVGTFYGTEGANPAVGKAGRRESVRELKVEVLCPGDRLGAVLAAIRASHPYEEPATDVVPLHPLPSGPGVGRLGRLREPMTLLRFAESVAHTLDAPMLQYVGPPDHSVERVAIACGAGDDFLGEAKSAGADVLLTGEARFHRALEADALGIGLILAGHHATERPGVEDLALQIAAAFPTLEVWPSHREDDPLRGIGGTGQPLHQ